jgi:RNA polymerase sigma-70 factor, ECF subfamily
VRPSLRVAPAPEPVSPPEPGPLDLDQLFRDHVRFCAGIGARLLGNTHEVDDLIQDVFIAAWRGLASIRNPAAVRGWLATITVRQARRRLRRRRLRMLLHLDVAPDAPSLAPGPETQAVLAQLYAQLDRLPTNHRLAWTLRHLDNEPLEVVAQLCECSLATAKRWIAAASRALAADAPETAGA